MSNDTFLDDILAPLNDMFLDGPLTHPVFSVSGRPFNPNVAYCANGEWNVSTHTSSLRPGVHVVRVWRFVGHDIVTAPLDGAEFDSADAAHQAQYEADLIVEFIPRDQRQAVRG